MWVAIGCGSRSQRSGQLRPLDTASCRSSKSLKTKELLWLQESNYINKQIIGKQRGPVTLIHHVKSAEPFSTAQASRKAASMLQHNSVHKLDKIKI